MGRFNDADYELQNAYEDIRVLSSSTETDSNGKLIPKVIRQPALVTPPSYYDKRMRYTILEYQPLLDSAK